MIFDDFEKKLLVSGLGIITLTLVFYMIHQYGKIMDEGFVVGTAVTVLPDPFPSSFTDLFMSIGQLSLSVATKVQGTVQYIAKGIKDAAVAAKNLAVQQGINAARIASDKVKNLSDKAATVASNAKTNIRAEAIAQKQKMHDRIQTIKQNIQIEKQRLQAEFKEKRKSLFTFRRFFKYSLLLVLLFSKIGRWAIKTTTIILLRIANMKSCFLWYALEIIGWILYIPMEFFVWFFCLQALEKSFWGIVEETDCFIHGILGFHVFYYSNYIRKKCFKPQLPPFPSISMGGMFTKDGFAKIIRDAFLPPDPRETAQYVAAGLVKYKRILMEDFKNPPNFDIKKIWKEAFDSIKYMNPLSIPKDENVDLGEGDGELGDTNGGEGEGGGGDGGGDE